MGFTPYLAARLGREWQQTSIPEFTLENDVYPISMGGGIQYTKGGNVGFRVGTFMDIGTDDLNVDSRFDYEYSASVGSSSELHSALTPVPYQETQSLVRSNHSLGWTIIPQENVLEDYSAYLGTDLRLQYSNVKFDETVESIHIDFGNNENEFTQTWQIPSYGLGMHMLYGKIFSDRNTIAEISAGFVMTHTGESPFTDNLSAITPEIAVKVGYFFQKEE